MYCRLQLHAAAMQCAGAAGLFAAVTSCRRTLALCTEVLFDGSVLNTTQLTVLRRSVSSEVVVACVRHCDRIFPKRTTKTTTAVGLDSSSLRV